MKMLARSPLLFLQKGTKVSRYTCKSLCTDRHLSTAYSLSEEISAHTANKNLNQNNKSTLSDDQTVAMMSESTGSRKNGKPVLYTDKVVPGKGPPPEPPVECCMSGCANCVWINYAESLKEYYSDGGKAALEALEQIENPSLKMFVKLEMGLL